MGDSLSLNREEDLGSEIDWQAAGLPRLWQYNLHYFDYLNQPGLDYDTGLSLISSWINQSSPEIHRSWMGTLPHFFTIN